MLHKTLSLYFEYPFLSMKKNKTSLQFMNTTNPLFNRFSYLRMLLTNFRLWGGGFNLCCFQTIFPVKMRIFQLIIVSSPQQAKTYQHQDLEATDKSKGSKSSKGFHYLTQTTCA